MRRLVPRASRHRAAVPRMLFSMLLMCFPLLGGCGAGGGGSVSQGAPGAAPVIREATAPVLARAEGGSPLPTPAASPSTASAHAAAGALEAWRALPPGTILAARVDGPDVSAFDPATGARRILVEVASPTSVAYGEDGFVYVAADAPPRVLRFDPSSGQTTIVADLSVHGGALDIAPETPQTLVAACRNGSIVRVDLRSGGTSVVAALPESEPYALTAAPFQNRIFAVARISNPLIGIDARTGERVAMPTVFDAGDVDVDAWGNLLVVDVFTGELLRFAPGATVPEVLNRRLFGLNAMAADTDGTVVGHDTAVLSRFFPDGSVRPIASGTFLSSARFIDVVPSVLLSVARLTQQRSATRLRLEGSFAMRDAVDVPHTAFTLRVNDLAFDIPVGGLRPQGRDRYAWSAATADGGSVRVVIASLGSGQYALDVDVRDARTSALADPTSVSLRVGTTFAAAVTTVQPRVLGP